MSKWLNYEELSLVLKNVRGLEKVKKLQLLIGNLWQAKIEREQLEQEEKTKNINNNHYICLCISITESARIAISYILNVDDISLCLDANELWSLWEILNERKDQLKERA